jgi:GH15 family glucan-1,4-alpha-glucosidase
MHFCVSASQTRLLPPCPGSKITHPQTSVRKEPGGVVFTIAGDNNLPEQTLDHWEGYRGSGPVPIGNDAVLQFQGDIYREFMDAFYLANKYVGPTSYDVWVKIRTRLEWI